MKRKMSLKQLVITSKSNGMQFFSNVSINNWSQRVRNDFGLVLLFPLVVCFLFCSLSLSAQNCSTPSTTSQSGCPGQQYTLSVSGGSNIQYFVWWDAATGGNN